MNKLLRAARVCARCAPAATACLLALEIAAGLLAPALVVAVAWFIDGALALAGGARVVSRLLSGTALLFGAYAFGQFSPALQRLARKGIELRLRERLRPRLVTKQAGLPYALMEDAPTLDLIQFACADAEGRHIAILSDFLDALRLGIQLTGIFAILMAHAWWLLPAFALGAVPLMMVCYRGGSRLVEADKQVSALTRRMYDLSAVLSGRETAAERILFGYTEGVNERFRALHLARSNMNTRLIARWELRANLCGIALHAFVLVAMAALMGGVTDGGMSGGAYIAVVGALIALARTISRTLSRMVFSVSEHMGYMDAYERFWALPEQPGALDCARERMSFERLEIRNLRFRYPGGDRYILDGLDLTMERGKSYSLIGANGAGKTTLTKILTGLYRDFEGEIAIDGIDIRSYSPAQLRGVFAVVYQDYAKYAISLRDNVTFDGPGDQFEAVARQTGLEGVLEALPMGADTPLGKVLPGGADVSGGEWQKIALARALCRDCPVILLDEPTASLSPMMESQIYDTFARISRGRTQLLISHRLGSTKISDVLLVLRDGRIAEQGTHRELMAARGLYADMFETQRSWYDERA